MLSSDIIDKKQTKYEKVLFMFKECRGDVKLTAYMLDSTSYIVLYQLKKSKFGYKKFQIKMNKENKELEKQWNYLVKRFN